MPELFKGELFSRCCKYNERQYTNLHYHNEIELYYLLRGRIKYFVNDKTFVLNEGDLMIIPKHVLHSTNSEDCLYNERLLLNFNSAHFHSEIASVLKSLCDNNIIHISKENQPTIESMFYKIESEYNNKKKNSKLLIKLYISELIIYLHRYKVENPFSEEKTDILIQKIADYININYDADLSLSKLSKTFSMSESYISRRFKLSTGVCINEYINHIRIARAEQLLKTEKLPIIDVALKCGYNDSSYFSSVFKKFRGITPYKFLMQQSNLNKNQK